jgi:hypothetical protein
VGFAATVETSGPTTGAKSHEEENAQLLRQFYVHYFHLNSGLNM